MCAGEPRRDFAYVPVTCVFVGQALVVAVSRNYLDLLNGVVILVD